MPRVHFPRQNINSSVGILCEFVSPHFQIRTQTLWCCLRAVWTLPFTHAGSICFASHCASCVDEACGFSLETPPQDCETTNRIRFFFLGHLGQLFFLAFRWLLSGEFWNVTLQTISRLTNQILNDFSNFHFKTITFLSYQGTNNCASISTRVDRVESVCDVRCERVKNLSWILIRLRNQFTCVLLN